MEENRNAFSVQCNNHASFFATIFEKFLRNQVLVDCTLAAEGRYVKAHKLVLAASSTYFEALILHNYDKHPVFILKDVKFKELLALMEYMYLGVVDIRKEQLAGFLNVGASLQIKGLEKLKAATIDPPLPFIEKSQVVNLEPPGPSNEKPHVATSLELPVSSNEKPSGVTFEPPPPIEADIPNKGLNLSPKPKVTNTSVGQDQTQSTKQDEEDKTNPTDLNRKKKRFRRKQINAEGGTSKELQLQGGNLDCPKVKSSSCNPKENKETKLQKESKYNDIEDYSDLEEETEDDEDVEPEPETIKKNSVQARKNCLNFLRQTIRFECPRCPQTFKRLVVLNNHIKAGNCTKAKAIPTEIKKPEKFACPYCGILYRYKENLIFHLQYECDIERGMSCEICTYHGCTKSLNIHMQKVHGFPAEGAQDWIENQKKRNK